MNYFKMFEHYLSTIKNYSKNTTTSYLKDLEDFNNFILSEGLAEDLTSALRPRLARHYLAHLEENNYSKKSIARKISSLRTFYNYMIEEKHLELNIFETLETPKIPKRLPKVISENIHRLLNIIQDASHGEGDLKLKVDQYLRSTQTDYLYRSCVYLLFDIIFWFKDLVSNNKDVEAKANDFFILFASLFNKPKWL